MTIKTLEVWIVVDPDGDYVIAPEEGLAVEAYNNDIGGLVQVRVVKLNVTLELPEHTEVEVDVPNSAGQTVTAEVA